MSCVWLVLSDFIIIKRALVFQKFWKKKKNICYKIPSGCFIRIHELICVWKKITFKSDIFSDVEKLHVLFTNWPLLLFFWRDKKWPVMHNRASSIFLEDPFAEIVFISQYHEKKFLLSKWIHRYNGVTRSWYFLGMLPSLQSPSFRSFWPWPPRFILTVTRLLK